MMNKKQRNKRFKVGLGMVIFAILSLLVYTTIVIPLITFDPEEDVCLEYGTETVFGCEKEDWIIREDDMAVCDIAYEINTIECVRWRQKTICEKNPEDEDCICDEYETKIKVNYSKVENKCHLFNFSENEEMNLVLTTMSTTLTGEEIDNIIEQDIDRQIEEKGILGALINPNEMIEIPERHLRSPLVSFIENASGEYICIESGGEWESVEMGDNIFREDPTLYYEVETENCIKAHKGDTLSQ